MYKHNKNTTKIQVDILAREWAEFLFEEYIVEKQKKLKPDTIKEMVMPTYHDESK